MLSLQLDEARCCITLVISCWKGVKIGNGENFVFLRREIIKTWRELVTRKNEEEELQLGK